MRIFFLLLLISLSTLLISCGGGGGGSSSNTAVKLSINLDFDNARVSGTSFYVSNTEIGSVTLDYENGAGFGGSIDITSSASSGSVELTELEIDSTYTFDISATGVDGSEVCSGTTNIFISPDVVNTVNLVCSFEETLAMENSVYDFITLAIENGGSLTEAQIDAFVATDFGLMDGMSRSEFITDMADGDLFEFTETGITLTKVDIIDPVARAAGTETFVDFYFSDGSVIRERIWMVEENGKWVLSGNDRLYSMEILATAFHVIEPNGTTNTYTGLTADFNDESGDVVDATISGTGLNTSYMLETAYCTDCSSLNIMSPATTYPSYALTDKFMIYDDLMTSSTELYTDPVYTVVSTYNGVPSTTDTITVYGSPVPLSTLTPGHFISISNTLSQVVTDYTNSPTTFQLVKPTAYTAKYIDFNFSLYDNNGSHFDMDGVVPMSSSGFTVDFASLLTFVPDAGELHLTAFDAEGKAYTTVVILDFTVQQQTTIPDIANTYAKDSVNIEIHDGIYGLDGNLIACGSTYDSADAGLIMLGDETSVFSFTFTHTGGDPMTICQGLEYVDYVSSSIKDQTYFVGMGADSYSFVVNLMDSSGNITWTKSYKDQFAASLQVVDTAIINNDNLLIVLHDSSKTLLVEIDETGAIVTQKSIELDGAYAGYNFLPTSLNVSGSSIFITGQYDDYVTTHRYNAVFVVIDTDFTTYNVKSTAFQDITDTSYIDSIYTSATVAANGDIILVGTAGAQTYGDIVISRYSPTYDTFYSVIYDNESVGSTSASYSQVYSNLDGSEFYLTTNFGNGTVEVMKFTFNGAAPSVLWQRTLSNGTGMNIFKIQGDAADNLVMFGNGLYGDFTSGIIAKINIDGDMRGNVPANFSYSVRHTYAEISMDPTIIIDFPSNVDFQVLFSDAANSLLPITLIQAAFVSIL